MTTLTDLINYYTTKLANPDLTPGSRKVASATLHHLTSMQAEIEIKESTMAGYRRENMMLHTEIKIKDEALTGLRAENTKLYADLCEMGDMARERSRKREAVIGIDLAGGADYTVDTLIRHKWPEDKPDVPDEVEFKVYLARYKIDDEFIFMDSVAYYKDTGWGTSGVTHWWNLPEVTE